MFPETNIYFLKSLNFNIYKCFYTQITLYTVVKGEKQTLARKLNLVREATSATLEVVDVKATNLKEIEVEFNQPVNKETLKSAFTASSLQIENTKIRLSDDGKTAILPIKSPLKGMENGKEYKLTISKVKSLNGVTIDKTTKLFTAKDTENPQLVGDVKVTGPRELTLEFSEPVNGSKQYGFKVKKNGKTSLSIAKVTFDKDNERIVTLALASNMSENDEYTLVIDAIYDYAGYRNTYQEVSFGYVAEKDSPIMDIEKATQKYVVVKFDRPVKGLSKENFYHTYSSYKALAIFDSKKAMDDATKGKTDYKQVVGNISTTDKVDTVYALFAINTKQGNHPLQEGDVTVKVSGLHEGRKVVDNWNNQLKDQEVTVNITADKEIPVVESLEVKSKTEFVITFSKDVQELKYTNIELTDESGKKLTDVSIKDIVVESPSMYTVVLTKDMEGKTVVVNIKDVKDDTLRENKISGVYSQTITFDDKEFKGLENAYLSLAPAADKSNFIFLAFSEAVDPDTATNIKNYKFSINGGALFTLENVDTYISDASSSVVKIDLGTLIDEKSTFYNKFKGLSAGNIEVHVSNNITDLVGNKFPEFSQVKPLAASATSSVKVVSKNNDDKYSIAVADDLIFIAFNEQIKPKDGEYFSPKGFEITKPFMNAEGKLETMVVDVDTVDFVEGSNNKQIALRLTDKPGNKLPANLSDVSIKINTNANIVDIYENPIMGALKSTPTEEESKTGIAKLIDGIAPSLIKIVDDCKYIVLEEFTPDFTEGIDSTESTIKIKAIFDENIVNDFSTNSVVLNSYNAKTIAVTVDSIKNQLIMTFKLNKDNTEALLKDLYGKANSDNYQYIAKDNANTKYTSLTTIKFNDPIKDANNANNKTYLGTTSMYVSNKFAETYKDINTLEKLKAFLETSAKMTEAENTVKSAESLLNTTKDDLAVGYENIPADSKDKVHGKKYVDKESLLKEYKNLTEAIKKETVTSEQIDALKNIINVVEYDLNAQQVAEGGVTKTVAEWIEDAKTNKDLPVKTTNAINNNTKFFNNSPANKVSDLADFVVTNKSLNDIEALITTYSNFLDSDLKTSAPLFEGVSFTDVVSNESTPSFEAGADKVYISKNPKTNIDTVYVVGEDLTSSLSSFVDITSKFPVNTDSISGDLSGYSSGTSQYVVIRLDASSKVVSYTFVTLKDQ